MDAIYTYAYVWPLDQYNVTHTAFHVESVAAVATRIQSLILYIERFLQRHHPNNTTTTNNNNSNNIMNHIVLVSHADVLQIAQVCAANIDNVGAFSSYRFKST